MDMYTLQTLCSEIVYYLVCYFSFLCKFMWTFCRQTSIEHMFYCYAVTCTCTWIETSNLLGCSFASQVLKKEFYSIPCIVATVVMWISKRLSYIVGLWAKWRAEKETKKLWIWRIGWWCTRRAYSWTCEVKGRKCSSTEIIGRLFTSLSIVPVEAVTLQPPRAFEIVRLHMSTSFNNITNPWLDYNYSFIIITPLCSHCM